MILVGEMRDLETMEAAIRAAETGHLVFATLHTTGAQGTINRIIDAFPVAQQEQVRVQLSTNLIAVLSQQLLARKQTGGRVAAYEFLLVTPAVSNLIRENKTYRIDSSIQTARSTACSCSTSTCGGCTTPTSSRGTNASTPAASPAEFQARMDMKARGQVGERIDKLAQEMEENEDEGKDKDKK